jgi:hypothetical protein
VSLRDDLLRRVVVMLGASSFKVMTLIGRVELGLDKLGPGYGIL